MNKIIFILLFQGICYQILGQCGSSAPNNTTWIGTGAGTLGTNNSNFGQNAGASSVSSTHDNTYLGYYSGSSNGLSGFENTGFGYSTLKLNISGTVNSAIGANALTGNQSGSFNNAVGYNALYSNYSGRNNTAIGSGSLMHNSTGDGNTAVGYLSLNLATSSFQTAFGYGTLQTANTSSGNVAVGYQSQHGSTGSLNTSVGANAMATGAGTGNTATGYSTFLSLNSGNYNTTNGANSSNSVYSGGYNSALGYGAGVYPGGVTLSNTSAFGYGAITSASNQVVFGNSSVTYVESFGKFGTGPSDSRFKTNIVENVPGLEFICQLNPVSYRFDQKTYDEIVGIKTDESQSNSVSNVKRRTGFIAQEVETLVIKTSANFFAVKPPQNQNDHYSLSYSDFVVPLVKAVQQLNQKLEQQVSLQSTIDSLTWDIQIANQGAGNAFLNDAHVDLNKHFIFSTTISESVTYAILILFNERGTQIKSTSITQRGPQVLDVPIGDLATGSYFCSLLADGQLCGSKSVLVK